MLRQQITLAFVALMILITLSAAVALTSADRALHQSLRSQAADRTLEGYFELSVILEKLLHSVAHIGLHETDGIVNAIKQNQRARDKVADLRKLVIAEAAVESATDGLKQEVSELDVLVAIDARLREYGALLAELADDSGITGESWKRLHEAIDLHFDKEVGTVLGKLIDSEREQAKRSDEQANRTLEWLRVAGLIDIAVFVALILTASVYFYRRIKIPYEILLKGTHEMSQGKLDARVFVPQAGEFEVIANNVNAIAADRLAKRDELLAQRDQLEEIVNTRTEELRLAMERVNAADGLRRQLFADISHELRTPLTAIRGEAEIALRGPQKSVDELQITLQRIITLSGQLARLIDDLLFISRVDNGSHRMNMTTVRLRPLISAACQDGRALAFERDPQARVVFDHGDREVTVFGDPDRLHQLFLILIDNAIRYSPRSVDVQVTISLLDEIVTVEVTDQGVGIPESEIPSLFLRFHRGSANDSAAGEGMGLGLPIAKAIVEAHGGSIEISSTLNEGTRVRVSLSVARLLRRVA